MRLLVTGTSGLLGLNLSWIAHKSGHEVFGWVNSRLLSHTPFKVDTVDLLDTSLISDKIDSIHPDAIIHCAAVANLEVAESNPDMAYRINTLASGEIASLATRHNIKLIYISTDAVFNGVKGNYVETDTPEPNNVYAKSKLAGEWAVEEANPDAIIARVNFFGWSLSGQRSLAEFFFNRLQAGLPMNGFTDVFFCPLYVEHLSKILLDMINSNLSGLYHVISPQTISKYEFGLSIAKRFNFNPSLISPKSVKESDLQAVRSLNLTLFPEKLQQALGKKLPNQAESLEAFYDSWLAGLPNILRSFL